MTEPVCTVDDSPKFQSIPPHAWGRDHLTTLLYIEARVVDHNGGIANQHMRCDFNRHPLFAHGRQPDGRTYPTRLDDGRLVKHHDDYDCLLDLADFGLVRIVAPGDESLWRVPFGAGGPKRTIDISSPSAVCVELTGAGWEIAAALRKHRGSGAPLSTFRLQYEVA